MWKAIPIYIASLVLAWISERNSEYAIGANGKKQYIKKDRVFFIILAVSMAVFAGLRTRYNDTRTYIGGYLWIAPDLSAFSSIDWALGSNPGFILANTCLRILGFSAQSYLMIYALVTIIIYIWFIRKYSDSFWLSIYFFITMECYEFTMAAIKQCISVALCLIAVDRALNRKWRQFVLWVLLASTFHPYALMYLAVPWLMFSPWSKRTLYMVGAFAILGFGLRGLLGSVVNITTMLGETYDIAEFSGEGVNPFRMLVVWAPVVLSFLARDALRKNEDKTENLMMNLSMLNAEIMFVALFGTANYFARLANYFNIFQTIALPWTLKFFNKNSRKLLICVTIMMYFLFCYCDQVIYHPFDKAFSQISLWEYLTGIFVE